MNKLEIITLNKPKVIDFAKERNLLLKKSPSEWAFFLDSDEKMSEDLKSEILSRIGDNNYNGFYVQRQNYLLGQYVGTDRILRLGKKGAGHWERPVHEIWKIKGKVGELKNPIIHNTASSLHDFIDKIDKYSTIHAEANFREGRKSNALKIIFFPVGKFFESLIIGRGFVMSLFQAFHSFLAWSKLYFLYSY